MHPKLAKKAGETDERLFAVAAWRETPYFTESERAALALTREQRNFVDQRNASFGRRGYDLRQAMEQRLDKLNTIARQ